MATGTMSRIGTEKYFEELCRETFFEGAYKTVGRPFSTHLRITGEKAEAALDEILEDVKRCEKAMPYLDSYDKRDLRQAVQALKEGADLKYPPKQTASEILRLIDGAAKQFSMAFSPSKVEDTADFIRKTYLPFFDGERKYEYIEKVLDGKVYSFSDPRERQFFGELSKLDERLVRAALGNLRSRESRPFGRCGLALGSSGYCMELLTRAFPKRFLSHLSPGASIHDAVMRDAVGISERIVGDITKEIALGWFFLRPIELERIAYIINEDLGSITPKAKVENIRDFLEKLLKIEDTDERRNFEEILKDDVRWIAENIVRPALDCIQRTMEDKDITYSEGLSVSLTPSIFNFSGQIGITIDARGNVAFQTSGAVGITTSGRGGSLTSYETITNAPSFKKLEKDSYVIGGSVGIPIESIPVAAGAEISFMPDENDKTKTYIGVTRMSGFGSPGVEGHAEKAYTWTIKDFNINDIAENIYKMMMEVSER